MSLLVKNEAPPIREDASGALRIGNSRVLLETIIISFKDGATPESLAQQYPTTSLAEIYAIIAYYLSHTEEIEQYLVEREKSALRIQELIGNGQNELAHIRQRLLSRKLPR